jgi:hypothetical protein
MAPSASKAKRLAEKAAKASSKGGTGTNTPAGDSINGGSTPMTSLSANGSQENLQSVIEAHEAMKKLNMATDRSAVSLRGFRNGQIWSGMRWAKGCMIQAEEGDESSRGARTIL